MRASSSNGENGVEKEKFMVTTPLYYANAGEECVTVELSCDRCDRCGPWMKWAEGEGLVSQGCKGDRSGWF